MYFFKSDCTVAIIHNFFAQNPMSKTNTKIKAFHCVYRYLPLFRTLKLNKIAQK